MRKETAVNLHHDLWPHAASAVSSPASSWCLRDAGSEKRKRSRDAQIALTACFPGDELLDEVPPSSTEGMRQKERSLVIVRRASRRSMTGLGAWPLRVDLTKTLRCLFCSQHSTRSRTRSTTTSAHGDASRRCQSGRVQHFCLARDPVSKRSSSSRPSTGLGLGHCSTAPTISHTNTADEGRPTYLRAPE